MKMRVKNKYWLWALVFLGMLSGSCASSRNILYMQDLNTDKVTTSTNAYEARIKQNDLLSIVVSGPDKTVVGPFNLTIGEGMNTASSDPSKSTLPYIVSAKGEINFPMLGQIKVEGLTRTQLVELLTKRIKQYVANPIVVVQFQNFRVSVIGEVRNPGTFNLPSERTTLLQALGLAGDLTIHARRDEILVIRDNGGVQEYFKVDLRKSDFLNSPAYYVQQNDVIYVAPSTSRIMTGTNVGSVWSIVLSSITTIIAVLAIIK